MMKIGFSKILFVLIALVGLTTVNPAKAQDAKIGYTTVELLLNYLPETKKINQDLQTLEKKLAEKLQIKQRYYQSEVESYMEKDKINGWSNETEKEEFQKKLMNLEKEIQGEAQQAELQLMQQRTEMLGPVQERMQKAIDDVAKEGGYTYILNNAVGSGIPTMLYGSESADVTEAIAKKLGVTIPEGE